MTSAAMRDFKFPDIFRFSMIFTRDFRRRFSLPLLAFADIDLGVSADAAALCRFDDVAASIIMGRFL